MNEDYDTGEGPYEDFNAFEISVYELLERLYPDYDFSEYKGLCAALEHALNRTGETVAVDLSDVPHHIGLAFYYAAKVRPCTEVCIDAIALAVERAVDKSRTFSTEWKTPLTHANKTANSSPRSCFM